MFNSQYNQDQLLEENIFKGFKNGFFMDIGAHDGITLNNTLYFEKHNNWTGINVEPIPEVFNKLSTNRPNCININCAVSVEDGFADFICNTGYTEMLSGLHKNYDNRHINRINTENQMMKSSSRMITVPVKRIETICDEHNIKHIHYLSVDVEGAEFDVIKSINFDKVFIDIVDFENNYDDVSVPIIKYLEGFGFKMIYKSGDIFMINTKSEFYKSN